MKKTELKKRVANFVRELRISLSLSQEEFAERLGITAQMVCLIENEKRLPSLELLIVIREVFNASIDSFLTSSSKTKKQQSKNNNEIQTVIALLKGLSPQDLRKISKILPPIIEQISKK